MSLPATLPESSTSKFKETTTTTTTSRPKKYAIRRRVVKVITTTEEEETDCKSRGGSPCMSDDQCCLGKCSPLGRCPTAAQLFDAAAITLKKEKDKHISQKAKEN